MTKAHTIFIVDDELTIRDVVRRYLERDGFKVIEAETGPQALRILQENKVDLILLDIMLPGLDGFTITRSLRRSEETTPLSVDGDIPIIMLTSRTDEIDRIMGFELGVDDYVTKPFSPRELVARVKAVLRRTMTNNESKEVSPLTYGDLTIDPLRRAVLINNRNIALTTKEFDLLWLLASHPQQVFTRDQLLDRVWGYEFYGSDSTVTVHIRRLREKIETNPSEPVYVQTVWGMGYKFDHVQ